MTAYSMSLQSSVSYCYGHRKTPYYSRTTSLGVDSRGEGGARQNLANRGLGSVEAAYSQLRAARKRIGDELVFQGMHGEVSRSVVCTQ